MSLNMKNFCVIFFTFKFKSQTLNKGFKIDFKINFSFLFVFAFETFSGPRLIAIALPITQVNKDK